VVHWLRKGCASGQRNPVVLLEQWRGESLEGGQYCYNEGCEVVGHMKGFKVCPQCKTARYCGAACQKQDWTMGGHREMCGTFAMRDTLANWSEHLV